MPDSEDNITLLDPSEGGRARARAMTPAERSANARMAAQARWDAKVPLATHEGVLDLAGTRLTCAVLADGTRLIAQGDMLEALGRATTMGRRGDTAPFVNAAYLQPYVTPALEAGLQPVKYRAPGKRFVSTGYPAELLPEICDVYLKAREDDLGRTKPRLTKNQLAYVQRAEILMRSLAKVGIVALVDEATGYEKTRENQDLQRLLAQYVEEGFRPWVRRFPDEFFTQALRIYGHPSKSSNKRPQYLGAFINEYVYKQFPEGVLDELQRVNPTRPGGSRSRTHHQHLTEGTGNIHLDRQITSVVTLMSVSRDAKQFKELFKMRFPGKREILRVTPTDDGQVTSLFELDEFE